MTAEGKSHKMRESCAPYPDVRANNKQGNKTKYKFYRDKAEIEKNKTYKAKNTEMRL